MGLTSRTLTSTERTPSSRSNAVISKAVPMPDGASMDEHTCPRHSRSLGSLDRQGFQRAHHRKEPTNIHNRRLAASSLMQMFRLPCTFRRHRFDQATVRRQLSKRTENADKACRNPRRYNPLSQSLAQQASSKAKITLRDSVAGVNFGSTTEITSWLLLLGCGNVR